MHLRGNISNNSVGKTFDPIDETRWEQSGELALSYAGIAFTLVASGLAIWEQYRIFTAQVVHGAWLQILPHILFCLILASLIGGSLVYQVTRPVLHPAPTAAPSHLASRAG